MERITSITFVPSFLSKSLHFYLFISSFCPEFCGSAFFFPIPILSLWNLAKVYLVTGVCFFFLLKSILTLYPSFICIYRCLFFNLYSVTFGVNILLAFINFEPVLAFVAF